MICLPCSMIAENTTAGSCVKTAARLPSSTSDNPDFKGVDFAPLLAKAGDNAWL